MNTTFVKWSSIENSYRTKEINYYRQLFPDLDEYQYVITEKLHGSNVSFHFKAGQPMCVARRNGMLAPDEDFYGVRELIHKYQDGFDAMQKMAEGADDTIRIYGEIFGPGVQKGVDYGDEKRIAFFGIKRFDMLFPFDVFLSMLPGTLMTVPIVATSISLQDALDFDIGFTSLVGNSLCEGIVIQPRCVVLEDNHGSPFLLKKKNEEFAEVEKQERVIDEAVNSLQQEIGNYVTAARLGSIFSKEGEISSPKQIGSYIKLMIEDVSVDFAKDYQEFADMDKGQQGQVLKVVGKLTANLLREYL